MTSKSYHLKDILILSVCAKNHKTFILVLMLYAMLYSESSGIFFFFPGSFDVPLLDTPEAVGPWVLTLEQRWSQEDLSNHLLESPICISKLYQEKLGRYLSK